MRKPQNVAIRYTQRLAEAGAIASLGSTGDSYDNAPAEAFNSLFKAELVRHRSPWKGIDDLEIAVAEYVEWSNHRRLHGELGLVPPVEFAAGYYGSTAGVSVPATVEALAPSLQLSRGETLDRRRIGLLPGCAGWCAATQASNPDRQTCSTWHQACTSASPRRHLEGAHVVGDELQAGH